MTSHFEHGYALLIGIDQSVHAPWSLPVAGKDVEALAHVFTDPERCAYASDKVRPLVGEAATGGAILGAMADLAEAGARDPDATIVIYYSGHGYVTKGAEYYLVPCDAHPESFEQTGLSARTFIAALGRIRARRLLVILDSCHAEGMGAVKSLRPPTGLAAKAPSLDLLDQLRQGDGRAVVSSCRSDQYSWILPDRSQSIFTRHLIEALEGAASSAGDTTVTLADLMRYVDKKVLASARRHHQVAQEPFFKIEAGDFPIALIRGGRGRPGAPPAERPGSTEAVPRAFQELQELLDRARPPLSRRLLPFNTVIEEKTRNFVGRDFIFRAIDGHLADPNFTSGYIVVRGEPGIGKSALASQLVRRQGYPHHFNIAAQKIRTAQQFLANVCAQLILIHDLEHDASWDHEHDSAAFSELLKQAADKSPAPVVVVVDALDEAEKSSLPDANRLWLPQVLPAGAFIVVTTREEEDHRLAVDQRRDIHLREDDPQNLEDVRGYIVAFMTRHQGVMDLRLAEWETSQQEFIAVLTERSEGNFMYLVYVLRDIRDGRLSAAQVGDIYQLPEGLRKYYDRHWDIMEATYSTFAAEFEPVIGLLATVREPVSVRRIAEWTGLSHFRVRQIIEEWREFLNEEQDVRRKGATVPLFRVYHASFRDFLKDKIGLTQFHEDIARQAIEKIFPSRFLR